MEFIQSWQGFFKFRNLPPAERRIVLYSEGREYTKYFQPVLDGLFDKYDAQICYLTSDSKDPILKSVHPRMKTFFIGAGSARIFSFSGLQPCVLVMTMPDLNTLHIKRSINPVHYCYLHHSMVSTHMVYREAAFDHFDSVLCVGPHHVSEIRAREKLAGLPPKQLFEHGYGPLDSLIAMAEQRPPPPPPSTKGWRILLAPSWGDHGFIENGGETLIGALLAAGHHVTLRLHPRTALNSPQVVAAIKKRFADNPAFDMNKDTSMLEALLDAHVMISDWSGVAMEFAFGLERPVLFIDIPRKVRNPGYEELGIVPFEVDYRTDVGMVLAADRVDEAPALVDTLCGARESYVESIRATRDKWIFNVAGSGARGADVIQGLAEDIDPQ